jgi:hypothetical protein
MRRSLTLKLDFDFGEARGMSYSWAYAREESRAHGMVPELWTLNSEFLAVFADAGQIMIGAFGVLTPGS